MQADVLTWWPAGRGRLAPHFAPGCAVPVVHSALSGHPQAITTEYFVVGVRGASSHLHSAG